MLSVQLSSYTFVSAAFFTALMKVKCLDIDEDQAYSQVAGKPGNYLINNNA